MTSREAADLLGVDIKTMYTYRRDAHENDFPAPRQFGRTLMWEREALLEWRKAHPARRRRKVDTQPEPDEGSDA
ncbi:helix-turn-helix transcriptional regulator [Plantactinospora sp. WMMB782]|uniref:helix-turn-helix transcriptional regulator n=1 Tax=Plantactinospora sp. WMMB782 TaxID=3404121 RepID=UPI003B954A88